MIDSGPMSYTPAEGKEIRERLRRLGPNKFVEQAITRGVISIRKLVTAFGVRPDLPYSTSWYYQILGLCIQRELRKRQKLTEYNTIDDAVSLLQKSKNILVITGAGISTSLGIPDFRSRNTGFYSQLLARGFESPEDVFDIINFDNDPTYAQLSLRNGRIVLIFRADISTSWPRKSCPSLTDAHLPTPSFDCSRTSRSY
jgi:NAD-dependent histone deacetylase SIR2